MTYTALIPVKSLIEAKSRLAPHLSPGERADLMLDMLHHVICMLRESRVLKRIVVVSSDYDVLAHAQDWGASTALEERAGHNPALTATASRELLNGATLLLTISADLPLLCPEDVVGMIEQSQRSAVVLASSRDGTGTNALLTTPPLVLPYLFGVGSLQRYQAEAERRQISNSIYTSIGLGLDIDTIEDIRMFQEYKEEYQLCRAYCA